MKYKWGFIFICLIICLFAVSGVCAGEVNETDISNDDVLEINSEMEDNLLEENEPAVTNSFTDLNNVVNRDYSTEVYLQSDFKYQSSDSAYKEGIEIKKYVTIYGNGHTIDGSNSARMFKVTRSDVKVVFKDITFINGRYDGNDGGGAIYGGIAVNCIFNDNFAEYYGGAIYKGSATDCTFDGNEAREGGAIYKGSATNCNFTNNKANIWVGGAISGGSAENCLFRGNYADISGGAVSETYVVGCTFIENMATMAGGAMGQNSAVNCIFINNTGGRGGAIYEGSALYCNFSDNHANVIAPAMFNGDATFCIFNNNQCEGTAFYPVITADNYTSMHNSGEKLLFNLSSSTHELFKNINTTIRIYKSDELTGTYYALSGNGWVVDLAPGIYTAVIGLDQYPEITPVNVTLKVLSNSHISSNSLLPDVQNRLKNLIIYLKDDFDNPIANANVSVDLNGVKNYITDENGEIEINTKSMSPDIYSIHVSFGGMGCYLETSDYIDLIINPKIATRLIASNLTTIYKKDTPLIVTLKDLENNPVVGVPLYVDLDGVIKNFTTDNNGQIKVPVNYLAADNYTAFISFDGDENYSESSLSVKIIINRGGTELIASDMETIYNSEDLFIVSLKDSQGNPISHTDVYVDFNGYEMSYFTNMSGQIQVPVSGFAADNYTALISFRGNENYTKSNKTVNVIIGKDSTKVIASELVTVYNVDKYLIVSLLDSRNNPLCNASLSVDLYGVAEIYHSDENGQISVLVHNLAADNYTAHISFDGNENYTGSNGSVKVIVNRDTTEILSSDVITVYNSDDYLVAGLISSNGHPISGADITVDLNGPETYKTNETGQIKVLIRDLAANNYTAQISFDGNENYTGSNYSVKVVVNKDISEILASELVMIYNDDNYLVASLVNSKSLPISGVDMTVDLNGPETYKTNETGQIRVLIHDLAADNYTALISFNGNENYTQSNTTVKITVKKRTTQLTASDLVGVYNSDDCLIVGLKDTQANPISGVDITVDLNGLKTYKTNESGQIKVLIRDLAADNYTAVISFNGNENYTQSNKTVKVTVVKSNTQIYASDLVTIYNSDDYLIAGLTDARGNPIGEVNLTVNLNGSKTYMTNETGQIKVPINDLAADNYTAVISFNGNENYTQSEKTVKVTVGRSETHIDASDLVTIYNSDDYLIAGLMDAQGRPISQVNLTVDLNGSKSYKTNETGQIKISTKNLPAKDYDAFISFGGNENYTQSSAAVKVIIRLYNTYIEGHVDCHEDKVVISADVNPNATGHIKFEIEGVENHTADVQVSSGKAVLEQILPIGQYRVVLTYSGDGQFNSNSTMVSFKVKLSTTVQSFQINVVYGNTKNIVVTLKDVNGKLLSGKTVSVSLNGVTYNKVTNVQGQVSVAVPKTLVPKTYVASFTFAGDDGYLKSAGSVPVKVTKAKATISAKKKTFKKAKKVKKYTITLKSGKTPIKKAKVTLKIKKKTYTAKTNAKGKATFKIKKLTKKGTYKATVAFKGNACYNKVSKKVKIKVK